MTLRSGRRRFTRRALSWPALVLGLGGGLALGIAVARRRRAVGEEADGPAAGAPLDALTTGGAPVAPGRPGTTRAVGGSDAPRPMGQPLTGATTPDPVPDGGAGAASGPAVPLNPTQDPDPDPDATGEHRTVLPPAVSAGPDGELRTE